MIELTSEPKGFYTFVKYKNDENGKPILETAELLGMFDGPNLITNSGMNAFATGQWFYTYQTFCCVGSGNATPQFTDTQLQSLVAQTDVQPSGIGQAEGLNLTDSANPYGFSRRVWRFENGSAAGNLQEVGVRIYGNDGTPGDEPLLSRALILDVNGNPTSITVLSDETLDVFWEIRVYIPTNDVTGSITLEGIVYNYTVRSLDVLAGNYGAWWYPLAQGIGVHSNYNQNFVWSSNPYHPAYFATRNNVLVPKETSVSDFTAAGGPDSTGNYYRTPGNIQRQPYVANSYQIDVLINFGLQEGNFTGGSDGKGDGIGALAFSTGMFGAYQVIFDKRVPKTPDKKWAQPIRISWARR